MIINTVKILSLKELCIETMWEDLMHVCLNTVIYAQNYVLINQGPNIGYKMYFLSLSD